MTADLLSVDRDALLEDRRLRQFEGSRSLVTGGLGFIGSNLARALDALGSRVTVLDSLAPGQGGNRFNLEGAEGCIDIQIADILDGNVIETAVRGQDFVFHIAGSGNHLDSLEAPLRDLDVNARATLAVLEAGRRENPGAKVVSAGTRSIYGRLQTSPVTEEHPLLPTEVNSANKAAADLYHGAYHVSHGLHAVSLRLTNTYGPRMLASHFRQGFINWFVRTAVEGGVFRLYGDGSQVRDLSYVDDTVHAHLLAAITPDAAGESFNVGSGRPVSLQEIARELVDIAGKGSIEYVPFPDDARRIEIGDYVADISKAERVLDWRPHVSLRDGLAKSVRYYEVYGERYW
jgi:nucleoside-diphosphate-sugar epimerase